MGMRSLPSIICMVAALFTVDALTATRGMDPFEFFQPSIHLTQEDRTQLDRDEPVARILPNAGGEIAVFAAVRVAVDGNRLVAWIRRIDDLKRSLYVPAIGRISEPPRIEDLADLELDEDDLADVRACRSQNCAIALSAAEMTQLQRAASGAGSKWRAAVQREFRRIVFERINVYQRDGLSALAPIESGDTPIHSMERFSDVLAHSVFLQDHLPRLAEHLDKYPHAPMENAESFLYWSKERLAGRPIVSVTHVTIVRGQDDGVPDALVTGKQVFATHYLNASLGTTAIVRGHSGTGNYLVYVNRSDVDVLDRWFGGVVRWFAERRVRNEAADILRGLRNRLESGEPPNSSAVHVE
jgi:hypothetical protein